MVKVRNCFVLVLFALLAIASQGCTTIYAGITPMPVDDESVSLGMSQAEVASLLEGDSEATDFALGQRVEYRYEDNESWRGRVMIYAPFGPADLIFLPIELLVQRAGQRWAQAIYDMNDQLIYFLSTRAGGGVEIELGAQPRELKITRKHRFLDAVLGEKAANNIRGEGT